MAKKSKNRLSGPFDELSSELPYDQRPQRIEDLKFLRLNANNFSSNYH